LIKQAVEVKIEEAEDRVVEVIENFSES